MFYRSIHYLRAIAALSVVALHAGKGDTPLILAAGVDVFFAISGFVMIQVARQKPSTGDFLYRRALRILPVYWAACIVSLFFLPGAVSGTEALKDMLFIPVFYEDERWLRPEYFVRQAWTLFYEIQFYLVFALCLYRWTVASAVLLALSAVWFVFPSGLTNPIMVEFIFGMGIAMMPHHIRERLAVPALILGAVGFWMDFSDPHIYSPERTFALGIPAALIVLGVVGLENRLPHVPPLHFLGSASYSIYLFHYLGIEALPDMPWPVLFIVGAGAGCAAHVLIEKPVLYSSLSRPSARPARLPFRLPRT